MIRLSVLYRECKSLPLSRHCHTHLRSNILIPNVQRDRARIPCSPSMISRISTDLRLKTTSGEDVHSSNHSVETTLPRGNVADAAKLFHILSYSPQLCVFLKASVMSPKTFPFVRKSYEEVSHIAHRRFSLLWGGCSKLFLAQLFSQGILSAGMLISNDTPYERILNLNFPIQSLSLTATLFPKPK